MMDQSGHTSIDTQRLRNLPLSSCKIEQPVPLGILRSRAPCAPPASIGGNRYHDPCCVECQSGQKNQLTGNWTEEIHFEDMRAHAPKIEEAVTPGLDVQEGSNQKSYQYQRQRGRRFAAER